LSAVFLWFCASAVFFFCTGDFRFAMCLPVHPRRFSVAGLPFSLADAERRWRFLTRVRSLAPSLSLPLSPTLIWRDSFPSLVRGRVLAFRLFSCLLPAPCTLRRRLPLAGPFFVWKPPEGLTFLRVSDLFLFSSPIVEHRHWALLFFPPCLQKTIIPPIFFCRASFVSPPPVGFLSRVTDLYGV